MVCSHQLRLPHQQCAMGSTAAAGAAALERGGGVDPSPVPERGAAAALAAALGAT